MGEQRFSEQLFMDSDTDQKAGTETSSGLSFADLLARAEKEELPVEEAFAALEQIIQKMEEDSISLEDSFSCYETGIRLVRYCSGRIDRVEKKVQMLRGEGEAPLEDSFED